jgi:hypothetical protein
VERIGAIRLRAKRSKSHAEAIDDRRFAEAIYRVALAEGPRQRTEFRDPFAADG